MCNQVHKPEKEEKLHIRSKIVLCNVSVKDLNYFMNKFICFNDIMKTLKLNVTV